MADMSGGEPPDPGQGPPVVVDGHHDGAPAPGAPPGHQVAETPLVAPATAWAMSADVSNACSIRENGFSEKTILIDPGTLRRGWSITSFRLPFCLSIRSIFKKEHWLTSTSGTADRRMEHYSIVLKHGRRGTVWCQL
ncbi:hypothetical protein PR003_g27805 [Phytophthora rubi]|uniref:Uncharacterized protein n=1 Tax=Phytophthora rubi TaxID=129364 RepID=A0A6A3HZ08_9STRA|nr:hypothetical protein PR002_g27537 [Phytophthora rubi]KAE8973173.1 hypothetical protein PR001_g26393 [Phytophthora rubi]KAE9280982.1 hypothetical protein PR003_g27805 [Phytophthora rubi]